MSEYRERLAEDAYRALNAMLGEPDQGSGTNSRRWRMGFAVADAFLASDALAQMLAEARAEALRQAAAEWASEYDRLTREQPNERKSRAAFRMASVLAEQRAALAAAEPDAGERP